MSDTHAVILSILLNGSQMSGPEIVKNSNGWLKRSTVYVQLYRLEEDGLISSTEKPTPKGQRGPARRVYSITSEGSHALAKKQESVVKLASLLGGSSWV